MSSVDEGVFERSADVLRRQAGHGRHHVTGKLPDAQRPSVLTPPPVMLRPERTHSLKEHVFLNAARQTGKTRPKTRSLSMTVISCHRTVITLISQNAKDPR